LKHASFFSGVGGLDLGFHRAGIETVSVSEIDPYANAVLAERFPSAPNLGSITEVNANDIPEADIWSGGFPCQDLSVAGKRAGFAGKRSSLAFTFLDLVEQRRPRWLVLENVPGLFSSNGGADFGRLLYEMEQLRYGVSWRTLDARYFGVAQRRRRVFLVASLESDRAGEVLLECEGCGRHPAPRWSQREGVASGIADGSGIASTLQAHYAKWVDSEGAGGNQLVIGAAADTDGMRAIDGMARRLDDQQVMAYQTRVDEKHGNFTLNEAEVANSLSALWPSDTSHRSMTLVQAVIQDSREMANKTQNGAGFSTEDISYTLTGVDRPAVFRKSARAQTNEDSETWVEGDVANTLNSFDVGDVRTTHAVVAPTFYERHDQDGRMREINISPTLSSKSDNSVDLPHTMGRFTIDDNDPFLPLGLDSHRYRCCGNGVVAPVAEWIGRRIVEVDRRWREEDK
jgi:DNA-cytosine methyltransferase